MQARIPHAEGGAAHLAITSWFHKSLKSCVSLFRWKTRTSFRHCLRICSFTRDDIESHVGQNTAQWMIHPVLSQHVRPFFWPIPKNKVAKEKQFGWSKFPRRYFARRNHSFGKKGSLAQAPTGSNYFKNIEASFAVFWHFFTWKSTKDHGKVNYGGSILWVKGPYLLMTRLQIDILNLWECPDQGQHVQIAR